MSVQRRAAQRGDALFAAKAGCNNCHVEPLWTEPGWNLHTAEDIGKMPDKNVADSLQRVLALYGHEVRVAYDELLRKAARAGGTALA